MNSARMLVSVSTLLAITSLHPSSDIGVAVAHAAEDARQIMGEAQKRGAAASQRYEGVLQSYDAAEKATTKRWSYERLGSYGQSKSIIRFLAPAEVKGVALLVVNHSDRASDQWMWTPAIERDRRIANQDRSTRFFGTDFSFEDLEERDVDQYDYQLLGEATIDGAACWKIQAAPKQTKLSQYSKLVIWVRKDNYASAQVESYVKDQPVRRLVYSDIKSLQGIWTAHVMTMTDVKRGSRTTLTLERVEYNLPLRDADFTLEAIRRQ